MKWLVWALFASASVASAAAPVERVNSYAVVGDAIEKSLTGQAGHASRGAELIRQRHKSLCVLCHSGPFPERHLQGTIAPGLSGVGARLSAGQLRLRIVDMKRLNPDSIMPTYYGIVANTKDARVAEAWRGKPVLTAEEIEDLVAYLQTLR
jgi:sulfur-oxidizing protein SoxX